MEHSPAGWELGTGGVTLAEEGRRDPLFADVPATFPAQQSHREIVAELPPGARMLAHTPHTVCQAFALGDTIWGTQFHPEFTSEVVHALIGLLADRLPAGSFPAWPADEQLLRDWLAKSVRSTPAARRCLDNFAATVRQRSRAKSSDDRVDNGRFLRWEPFKLKGGPPPEGVFHAAS